MSTNEYGKLGQSKKYDCGDKARRGRWVFEGISAFFISLTLSPLFLKITGDNRR